MDDNAVFCSKITQSCYVGVISVSNFIYETHKIDERLPFIFHTDIIKNGRLIRPNWHSNVELQCCISGEGVVRLNADMHSMRPGDVVVINSEEIHATCAENEVQYHCLIIDNRFFYANGLDATQLRFQHLIHDPELFHTIQQIAEAYSRWKKENAISDALQIRRDVLEILCVLYDRYRQPQEQKDFLATQRIKTAMDYVRQNLSSQVSLDVLAGHVGVSKFHLSREFKRATGMTVVTYINLCRCTEARQMILDGIPVSNAALACGFENMSYFTRTFKQLFGCVPSAYQKRANR